MSLWDRYAPSRKEVRDAFANGRRLENTEGKAARGRAAAREQRQREHEQVLGYRRPGRAK
jgi:hypothetical protein